MIDLKKYRLVDISQKLVPGKVLGPLGDKRRLEIRRFAFEAVGGEFMHEVDMENHIGTHIEYLSHYADARYGRPGKDISKMPLKTFVGEAVFIDLASAKPRHPIMPKQLEAEGVHEEDIVIIGNSPYQGSDRPYVSHEAAW